VVEVNQVVDFQDSYHGTWATCFKAENRPIRRIGEVSFTLIMDTLAYTDSFHSYHSRKI
jgi:hypothetical protein